MLNGHNLNYLWATHTCGLGLLGKFLAASNPGNNAIWEAKEYHNGEVTLMFEKNQKTALEKAEVQGTGYVCVGYIKDDMSEKYRAFLNARWPVVFTSDWRLNANSGNDFQFVIYDARVKL